MPAASTSTSSSYAAPKITLLTSTTLGTSVTLKQGASYAACAAGVNPTATQPCELGATGTDALGASISSTAVACAPSSCASFATCSSEYCLEPQELTCLRQGCASCAACLLACTRDATSACLCPRCQQQSMSPLRSCIWQSPGTGGGGPFIRSVAQQGLQPKLFMCKSVPCSQPAGYSFGTYGLARCGLNVSAALGTVYSVNFTVFDRSVPPQKASTARTITIVNPCATGEHGLGALPVQNGCLFPAWTTKLQSAAIIAPCANMLPGIEALSHLGTQPQEEVAPGLQMAMAGVLMLMLMLCLVMVPDCPRQWLAGSKYMTVAC